MYSRKSTEKIHAWSSCRHCVQKSVLCHRLAVIEQGEYCKTQYATLTRCLWPMKRSAPEGHVHLLHIVSLFEIG